ncbi:MAG: C40 family peptidase [Fimbriimonadaceae bacterium]|nr:C40 family peptidase [Fimbriimonadaceae bacterium]
MSDLDPRLHPYRADLAGETLRGRVPSDRFVAGTRTQVVKPVSTVRGEPRVENSATSQLVYGEVFIVFEEREGWSWGQNETDGYVGYVRTDDLSPEVVGATHRIAAVRTLVFAEPSYKAPVIEELGFQSQIRVVGERDRYSALCQGGWIVTAHAVPLDHVDPDYLATARRFVETPYRWGGRSGFGIDCSALVQACLAHAGVPVRRDSDMQAATLGEALPEGAAPRSGDFVFWPGHVAMLLDQHTVIHAASTPLKVCVEPLAIAQQRNPPESLRRRLG